MKKKKKKRIIIPVAIILFLLISNTIATKIIYDSIFSAYQEPVSYDTSAEETLMEDRGAVEFTSGKNTLVGYFYDNPDSEDMVVIAPGLHSGADDYISLTQAFYTNGYDVFSFDPTGTDASEGKSNKSYSQESLDLDAALDYIENNYEEDRLVLLGHSRGATAACSMLTSDHDIDAVISVSGFNSAMDAIIGLSENYVGPVARINQPTLWLYQATLVNTKTLNFKSTDAISQTDTPVLVLQGQEDDVALDGFSTYSYLEEESTNAQCVMLEDCGHTDILYDSTSGEVNADTMDLILDFLASAD